MSAIDKAFEHAVWRIDKYADADAFEKKKPYAYEIIEGNLLLNEGINFIWDAVTGSTSDYFDYANSYLGVGDSAVAASATQTGLQAAVNKFYKGMEAGYPVGGNQQITFMSIFTGAEANFVWNEFTVSNYLDDTGVNLNRKVSAQGTKASPQIWTLVLTITLA